MPRVSGSAWPWLLADDSDAIVGIRSGNVDQLFVFSNDDALNIDMSNLAATWNSAGTTFNAIKMNVTDTASAAASLLLDLQVGGTSQFRVSKGGRITAQTLTIGLGGQTAVATNTALGFQALNSASLTGADNVGVGHSALLSTTTGFENTAVGSSALANTSTGAANSAFGLYALLSNIAGNNNSALGRGALLFFNTSNNVAVGVTALRGSTTVANNTASNCTALGTSALFSLTTGNANNALGMEALYSCTTGTANTAAGYGALSLTSTGSNNTAVGDEAGDVITTGARNTIIGANSDPSAAAGVDQTVVGEGLTGKGDDTAFIGGTNGAYNEKNVTTWETTSDARIKKDIADFSGGLEVLEQVRVRSFRYRTPEEITELPQSAAINQPGVQLGVIAQELQAVLPQCVTENSTGVLSVNTDPLVWYLVNAVKQLSARVAELEGKSDV